MFTIMHISDLHRSPTHPISNEELISCLLADHERQRREIPSISSPDAVIVTGDIIQGVPLDFVDYTSELRRQYNLASEFLDELAQRFVEGDRSRIIILPGNHDVDWNTAYNSMKAIDENSPFWPQDLRRALAQQGSPFRWCWKTRRLFRINDHGTYHNRFSRFWEFFSRFYEGVKLSLPISVESYYNLFELNGGKIVVTAYSTPNMPPIPGEACH
jgi:predicted MPP superfamily phosphohydrolase